MLKQLHVSVRAIHRSKDRRHEALLPAPTLSIVREKFPDPFFHRIQVCRRRARARSNKPKPFRKNRNEGLIKAQIETVNRKTIELWEVWTTSNEGDAWTFLGRFDTAKEANIEALNHSLAQSLSTRSCPYRCQWSTQTHITNLTTPNSMSCRSNTLPLT